jgi:hypothetical protein
MKNILQILDSRQTKTALAVFFLIAFYSIASLATENNKNVNFKCTFSKDNWKTDNWIMVKSPRWPHSGTWIQKENHIVNHTPEDATKEEMLNKKAGKTYTSMLYKNKIYGNFTVSTRTSFDYRMAPLIVLSSAPADTKEKHKQYREHYEIVLYDKGINIWHHMFDNNKPHWEKIAYLKAEFTPKTIYKMNIKISTLRGSKYLTVTIGKKEMQIQLKHLPDPIYAGITGCEGKNRFYNFEIKQ